MANANTAPIYSKAADIQASAGVISAVGSPLHDGVGTIGTDIFLVWQADATNGGFLQRVRIKYVSNGTTASVACVLKLFISTQASGATTNTNTWLYDEVAIPSTGALATTTSVPGYDVPFNFAIPAGYTILAKITVAQTNSTSGFICMGIGGKF